MEAVHNHTSTANQMEHQIFPNNHISKTSLMAENGRTMMPSVKSAQAKETEQDLAVSQSRPHQRQEGEAGREERTRTREGDRRRKEENRNTFP